MTATYVLTINNCLQTNYSIKTKLIPYLQTLWYVCICVVYICVVCNCVVYL